MKYDFIEIGTSNFDTLIETADDDTVGLSIEPIRYYLDQLPNRAGVKKLAVAISRNHGMLPVFYIPERTIRARGLPEWLRGCNSVGDYHPKHVELMVRDLVQIDTVDVMTIADIFDLHDVTELDYLKIDTEGADCDIMLNLFKFLESEPRSRYPKKILFESNELANQELVEAIKNQFVVIMGYRVTRSGYDTVLEL